MAWMNDLRAETGPCRWMAARIQPQSQAHNRRAGQQHLESGNPRFGGKPPGVP